MSLARAYAMKKRMAKGGMMAEGGEVSPSPTPSPKAAEMAKSMRKAFNYDQDYSHGGNVHGTNMVCMSCGGKMMAEGGFVGEEEASGYHEMPNILESHIFPHEILNQNEEGDDMISGIMRSRAKGYSEGGEVANDVGEGQDADKEANQFDDLVKDDDLEFSETGANSGDEIGDEQEDEDREDMVSDIMKSRKKKDRLPHPA